MVPNITASGAWFCPGKLGRQPYGSIMTTFRCGAHQHNRQKMIWRFAPNRPVKSDTGPRGCFGEILFTHGFTFVWVSLFLCAVSGAVNLALGAYLSGSA